MGSRKRKPLSQLTADCSENIVEKRRKNNQSEALPDFLKGEHVRAGCVLRMILKNFMCHSHLEVSFNNNNINYIVGRNGSGKSAILTALVIGLGGKATLTNRGSSIKGFIKNGKNWASVEITLSNSGFMAYKHEIFGDKIIIERVFRVTGSGNYKIKSTLGQVISTSAKDIQHICTSFNIQIDNPICLLNQDTSRTFLNTTDTHQKFLLFMKATGLEELLEEYQKVLYNKQDAKAALKEKESDFKELERNMKELESKIKNHQNIAKLKAKVIELHKEFSWAKVRDAEDEMQEKVVIVNAIAGDIEIVQNEIENGRKAFETFQVTNRTLDQQIQQLYESIQSQNMPQNIIVNDLGELKEEINNKTRENRSIQKDIALKSGNHGILEKEIQRITQNFSQLEQDKIKRIEDINSLEMQIKSVESLMETSKNDQFQSVNSMNQLKEQERSIRGELDQLNGNIENMELRISSLKDESTNSLSLYGSDMGRVVEAINKYKHKFRKVPRGPLGNYIKLKDKRWAIAVESFITPTVLRAFTVDNKKDNLILMKIFDQVWSVAYKPMVITSKFFDKVHDVSQHLVQPIDGCVSVYSVLEISDVVVANCLIDQSNLETVLLTPNGEKAIELMSNERRVPRNCRLAITIKGDKYYPDPNYKFYSSRYHNAQFLQVSVHDMINRLEKQFQVELNKKEVVLNQHNAILREVQQQLQKIKELQHKIVKLAAALRVLQRDLSDLENVAEPDVASIHGMENEMVELKAIIEEKMVAGQKVVEEINELKRKIERKEEKLNEIKSVVRGYEERVEALNNELQENNAKSREYEINKGFASKRLSEFKKKLTSAQNDLNQKGKVVEDFTRDASTLGSRPNVLRQVNDIMDELKQDQRTIRSIESDIESINEVFEKYRDCKDRIKQVKEVMNSMISNLKDLQVTVDKRNRYYQLTEDYFITFVKHSFEKVLQFRQFKGTIEIDMNKKTLDMIVIPQQGSQGQTLTSNLSGGERSFSTVAFLYSLWQCMDFPFYFLDEFDVFMDKVNRSKVMEILVYHAKSRPDLQFVFLTPQDVSFVDKSVAIHKLSDPERRAIEDSSN